MLKRDKIWIFFILFIVIFQYSEIIFHQKIFFIRDLTYIFHPWKSTVIESLLNGKMPLWNPYSYCGMPLMANFQTAVFYPFSLFFYIFGFISGLKLFIIIHTFLAALFLFLYLRSKKISAIASVTGGVLFAFGGYLITKIEFLSLLGTAIWLPLILLLFSGSIFICALAVSISLFAGYPPVLFFIMIFLFAEAVVENKLGSPHSLTCNFKGDHPLKIPKTSSLKFLYIKLKKFVLIVLLSASISAIQILPATELVLNSVRKSGLIISDANIWSVNYSDLLAFLAPIFVKKESTALFTGEKYFWLKSFWIGFVAAIISFWGVLCCFKKSFTLKKSFFYIFLICFSLLFALGENTPVYLFTHNYIPGFNLIRYPAQILFIPFFIFIIFMAIGLNKIKKMLFLFLFLIVFELLFYSYKIHPTILYDYYKNVGLVAHYLQKDKGIFRIFSTPKTAKSEKIAVPNYGDIGWYILRDRITGLISIPFHIYDAGGIGEPLETKEHADLILEIQKKNNADEANELLSLMNVKYLLSDYHFKSKFWALSHKSHLFIYKNKNFIERSFISDKNNNRKKAKIIFYLPEKIKIETKNSGTLILSDTFYPGWQVYVNGQKTDIKKDRDAFIFRSVKLQNSPNYKIYFLYNPVLFTIGVLISLLSISIIINRDISTLTSI